MIQINYTDLENFDTDYNCIAKLKESAIFDKVVLAAPDINENLVLEDFAREHGVEIFLGEVNNVAKRILDCCRKYHADIAARVLVNWFFIDTELIKAMLRLIENTKADYINLPKNFDIRFGADVFRSNFLVKLLSSPGHEEDKMLFNPWGYADAYPEKFNIVTFPETPQYPQSYFEKIRETFNRVWPERHDLSYAPLFPYQIASKYIQKAGQSRRVLDIACGLGNGTNLLSDHCDEVFGVDIDMDTIVTARERFSKSNIKFVTGNAEALAFSGEYFDVIVSIHTMEHLHDDDGFLRSCAWLLKHGGFLIIEVPKLREHPFRGIKTPLSALHIREYCARGFTELLSKHFDIVKTFGVSRGFYLSLESAREALLALCQKKYQ